MSTHITKNRILDFTISLKIQHRSPNTIISYTTNIQKLELFLNGEELSKEQMISYKQWLYSQGLKKNTINAYLAAANYFCDVMGWADMKVALDPANIDGIEQNKKQISSSDYKKLVFTALQNDKERLAMMIQVLCHMDLRFCELEKLTIEVLDTGIVEVDRGHRHKKIKIPDDIIEDLYTYALHEKIMSGIIFRTSKGSPVDRSNFRKDIKKLCVLAGVKEELGSIQHVKHVVLDEYPYYGLKKWK
ncbi:MAG: phage integrase N-terminal SAM-like domain-containing protein [Lachnospiraceae bacterium]|jgi:Site-specific recombinase XerD